MPITLKELAAQAGVHPSTVSRIVNNDPRVRVSPETRARVKSLLKKTGYRPDGMARGLKLRQSFVLGVLVPDVLNPLFAAIFRGVEDAALEEVTRSSSPAPTATRTASARSCSRCSRE